MDKSKSNRPRATSADGGWQAYRKWLAGVGADTEAARRPRADASLYSWKGYHSWADKVRRSWDSES
ncbi:MAG: hypothetical protein EA371_08505 [Gammaproteobacteria bacterium]|nr:MAG: hypothetical protein EA371_08505 [Gammaproteobacteria bacterium]